MLYSLTDKLNFNDRPQVEIKGKILTIDNSATTVLKLMDTVQTQGELAGAHTVLDLLFSAKDKKVIEGLNLSIDDFIKFCEVCMDLALGNDPDAKQGEWVSRTTI